MSEPLSARLDALVRQLGESRWIQPHQLAELREIARIVRGLRSMSDRARQAIYLLLESVEIKKSGAVIIKPGSGQDFYFAISELNKLMDEVRPKMAGEKRA